MHFIVHEVLHEDTQLEFDSLTSQCPLSISLGTLRHRRKHRFLPVDEVDVAQFGATQLGVVLHHNVLLHFGEDARQFHTRWPGTGYGEREQLVALLAICSAGGPLETRIDQIAQHEGVTDRLHRHGFGLDVRIAEEIGLRTCGHNQQIVIQLAIAKHELLLLRHHGLKYPHAETRVRPFA